MQSTIIMSHYPIYNQRKKEVAEKTGEEIDNLIVSNIVHDGYVNLARQLHSIRCEKIIILSNLPGSAGMMPVFRFMALLVTANQRYVLSDDNQLCRWRSWEIIYDILYLAFSFFAGVAGMAICVLYFGFINAKGRVPVNPDAPFDRMRILYLRSSHWYGQSFGGAMTHAHGVIQGFLDIGFKVHCVSDREIVEIPMGQGETIKVASAYSFVIPRELNYFNFQHVVTRLLRRQFGKNFNGIIYQRIAGGAYAGVVASRYWRVPLILEYNGNEDWLAQNWGTPLTFRRIVLFLQRSMLRHAHTVVAVSEPLKRELVAVGVEENRIVVCPNGVDTNLFKPNQLSPQERRQKRAALGFNDDDFVFTFTGSFGYWHGTRFLADAINETMKKAVADPASNAVRCKFLFVGAGPELPSVQDALDENIKKGAVVIYGAATPEEIPVILDMSDACLAPTLRNSDGTEFFGSPTKIFEYFASGKPVIASAVGQVKMLMRGSPTVNQYTDRFREGGDIEPLRPADVADGRGLFYEAGDVEGLVSAFLLAASSGQAMMLMGANARKQAVALHTWTSHVSHFMDAVNGHVDREMERPKRLLINALHAKSGGGVTYLRNMLPFLNEMSAFEVHILLHRAQLPLYEKELGNAHVHISDARMGLFGIILVEQFGIRKLVRKLGIDVVFSPANFGPLFIKNAVILIRNSLNVANIEKRPGKLLYWGAVAFATLMSILTAQRIIAVSTYACSSCFKGMFRAKRKKVDLIPHGVHAKYFDVERKPSEQPFVLAVSDIYVQKNLHVLIEAFAGVVGDNPDLVLKLAGRVLDVDYHQRLMKLVDTLGLSHAVEFLGNVHFEGLLELYGACEVFVFPSTVETFGNPLVEAMASGCPVICSNAAAMPEVAGDAVLFVDPDKPDQLRDALQRFLMDETLCTHYGRLAQEWSHRYSWAVTAEETAKVLSAVDLA